MVSRLREDILQGRLRPGERLPAEEALASQFSVSRGTLRTALAGLEKEGLIRRRRNQGCIVTASSAGEGLMAKTVVLLSDVPDVIEPHVYSGRLQAINSGVFDAVTGAGLNFLSLYGDPGSEETVDNLLKDRPYAVLINEGFAENLEQAQQTVARLVKAGVPVVIHFGDSGFEMADRIGSDHEDGAYQVVRWLAKEGRKRIQRIWTTSGDWWIKAHDRGYERAVRELGLEPLPQVVIPSLAERQAGSKENFEIRTRQVAGFLIDGLLGTNPIDAVMVPNDGDAFLVATGCRLLGKIPNKDISIAGYDNCWQDMPERQWEPATPIISVDKQNHLIGEELVHLMLERIAGKLPQERQYRSVPQQLVIG